MSFLGDLYGAAYKAGYYRERTSPYIIGDKGSYVSPMDRAVVDGRTAHREHMKQHGVLEAGDMKLGELSGGERALPPARQDIERAIQELSR